MPRTPHRVSGGGSVAGCGGSNTFPCSVDQADSTMPRTLDRVSGVEGGVVGCGDSNSHTCSVPDQAEQSYLNEVEPEPNSGGN